MKKPSVKRSVLLSLQWGLIILVGLMPFHAFFSVWLGHLIGHQAIIQAWKEVLLALMSLAAAWLIWRDPAIRRRLNSWPILLIGAFGAVALVITVLTRPSLTAVAFGAKTDFEFLLAFILAALVSDRQFVQRLTGVILGSAAVVIGFGLLQITVLPPDFLTRFGYGPGTVPPYLVLDPAVSSLRFGSTLGGPNQLGTYLMLPLVLALVVAVRRRRWWLLSLGLGALPVLFHTHSRSAWIGAALAIIISLVLLTPRRLRLYTVALIGLGATAAVMLADQLLKTNGNLQYYLFHSSQMWHGIRGSDFEHLTSLQTGISSTLTQPAGHGLGSVGPATFYSGQGTVIENNFLQISYETGMIGGLLFVATIATVIWQLGRRAAHYDLATATLAAMAGISVTAMVLPAWTDSTTALVVWTAAGSLICLPTGEHDV